MRESNLYSPSCRAQVCVTFCMNVTAGREFLGLHPFFAPKNGWNIKQQFGLFFFLYVHFFYFNTARKSCAFDLACLYSKRYSIVLNRVLEQKRKKRTKEREKPVFTKEILKFRNENFRPAKPDRHAVGLSPRCLCGGLRSGARNVCVSR